MLCMLTLILLLTYPLCSDGVGIAQLVPFQDHQLLNFTKKEVRIPIKIDFLREIAIGKEKFLSCFVYADGKISFGKETSVWNPAPMETIPNGTTLLAPFWMEVNVVSSGGIYFKLDDYRKQASPTVATFVRQAKELFNVTMNLTNALAAIFTWDHTRSLSNPNVTAFQDNSFQCILLSDGKQTFVLFTYNNLDHYKCATTPGTAHAGVKFADGDYINLPYSGTPSVVDLMRTQNVKNNASNDARLYGGQYQFKIGQSDLRNESRTPIVKDVSESERAVTSYADTMRQCVAYTDPHLGVYDDPARRLIDVTTPNQGKDMIRLFTAPCENVGDAFAYSIWYTSKCWTDDYQCSATAIDAVYVVLNYMSDDKITVVIRIVRQDSSPPKLEYCLAAGACMSFTGQFSYPFDCPDNEACFVQQRSDDAPERAGFTLHILGKNGADDAIVYYDPLTWQLVVSMSALRENKAMGLCGNMDNVLGTYDGPDSVFKCQDQFRSYGDSRDACWTSFCPNVDKLGFCNATSNGLWSLAMEGLLHSGNYCVPAETARGEAVSKAKIAERSTSRLLSNIEASCDGIVKQKCRKINGTDGPFLSHCSDNATKRYLDELAAVCTVDQCKANLSASEYFCPYYELAARQCMDQNPEYLLEWRNSTDCLLHCGENEEPVTCGSRCFPSCSNPAPFAGGCSVPGCFSGCTCKFGYVFIDGKCQPENMCGCVDKTNGMYRKLNSTWLADGCTQQCRCKGDPNINIECIPHISTCHRNAECRIANETEEICICRPGYAGDGKISCAFDFCSATNPCHNGARCINVNDTHAVCQCSEGFNGSTCETRLPNFACRVLGFKCENGGTCDERDMLPYCTCPKPYTGERCEIAPSTTTSSTSTTTSTTPTTTSSTSTTTSSTPTTTSSTSTTTSSTPTTTSSTSTTTSSTPTTTSTTPTTTSSTSTTTSSTPTTTSSTSTTTSSTSTTPRGISTSLGTSDETSTSTSYTSTHKAESTVTVTPEITKASEGTTFSTESSSVPTTAHETTAHSSRPPSTASQTTTPTSLAPDYCELDCLNGGTCINDCCVCANGFGGVVCQNITCIQRSPGSFCYPGVCGSTIYTCLRGYDQPKTKSCTGKTPFCNDGKCAAWC